MGEIGRSQVVAHSCSRASRVDIGRSIAVPNIVEMHGSEIDAVAGQTSGIGDGRMQMRGRELIHGSNVTHHTDRGFNFDGFLGRG